MQQNSKLILAFTSAALVLLQGCNDPNVNNRELGTILGGIGGAVVGSNIADKNNRALGTVVGAIAGGFLGNQIGKDIDQANRSRINHVLSTQRSNEPYTWQDPDHHASFVRTTSPSFRDKGRICRPYKIIMFIDGKKSVKRGTACRVGRNEWQMIN